MDLIDRLLAHDAWTTQQILNICLTLTDEQLDQQFGIGHGTLRGTLHHIVHNMEVWSSLMAEQTCNRQTDRTIPGMIRRLEAAETQLKSVARRIADADAWDEMFIDHLDDPPRRKSYGTAIAHIITHSMHHRAQLLYMLRLTGVESTPEGDVFCWEAELRTRGDSATPLQD